RLNPALLARGRKQVARASRVLRAAQDPVMQLRPSDNQPAPARDLLPSAPPAHFSFDECPLARWEIDATRCEQTFDCRFRMPRGIRVSRKRFANSERAAGQSGTDAARARTEV